jgi:hypothetical protein
VYPQKGKDLKKLNPGNKERKRGNENGSFPRPGTYPFTCSYEPADLGLKTQGV